MIYGRVHGEGRSVYGRSNASIVAESSPLLTGLVAYWNCDELSGNLLDSVGGHHLTDNNTVTAKTGLINNGRDFERDNSEYFEVASDTWIEPGNSDWWFNFWFKMEAPLPAEFSGRQLIAKDIDTPANSRDFTIAIDVTAGPVYNLRFYINGGGAANNDVIVPIAGAAADTWYMGSAWYDSSDQTIHIAVNNGTPDVSTGGVASAPSGAPLRFGARAYASFEEYFDGMMDEIGYWSRIPTAQDLTDLYNGGAGLAYPFS